MRKYLVFLSLFASMTAQARNVNHLLFADTKMLQNFMAIVANVDDLNNWTKKDKDGHFLVSDQRVSEVKRQTCEFLRIRKCAIEISPMQSVFKDDSTIDLLLVTHKPSRKRQVIHLPTGKRLEIPKDVPVSAIQAQRLKERGGSNELLIITTHDGKNNNARAYLIYPKKTQAFELVKIPDSDTFRLWDVATDDKALAYSPVTGILYKGVNLDGNLGEYVQFKNPVTDRATSSSK